MLIATVLARYAGIQLCHGYSFRKGTKDHYNKICIG